MRFSDLPNGARMSVRSLCEALGARVEYYSGGCVELSMPPSADKLGWSSNARTLHDALISLGFEREETGFRNCTDIPNDPMAGPRGILYSAWYRPTRNPFPFADCA